MALQFSKDVRNAQADAAQAATGAAPVLEVRSGPPPPACHSRDSGLLVASGHLPSDWLSASADGMKRKAGAWSVLGQPAAGDGAAGGHFRIKQGDVCHWQGTFTGADGKGDMVANTNWIAHGQIALVAAFNYTRGNA